MPPETIAHYRISSKLGEGAMGEVYRATTRDLQRLLFVLPVQESAQRELDFVLNWQAGLRR